MSAKKLAVVTAGLSQPSSTRLLADRLAEATVEAATLDGVEVEVTVVELRDIAQDITNNLLTGFPSGRLQEAIDQVTRADGLIAVTPIFSASYSGLFKSFFDVIDNTALDGLATTLAATGGSARHSLALEHELRPLFSYLRAATLPTAVFAASEDWGSGADGVSALPSRVRRAGRELAGALGRSDRSSQVRDEFALDADFSPFGGVPTE
ncbi:FMN reductase [Cnuibacter sp. UC19_7]|uniref:FMN reductase n=1 Tax=Cnuibacter sp. UC19_7 TaxID=3350166 RepID=UPI00366F700E